MKNFYAHCELGATLVELLSVLAVILSTGVVVGAIIFSTFRGSSKTNILIDVRQNGTYALSQMQKMIQFAKRFNGVSNDNVTYVTDCTLPAITPVPSPAAYKYIKITSFDDGVTIFSCGDATNPTISSNAASLLDSSKVALVSCSFVCTQSAGGHTAIDINFSLAQKDVQAASERTALIPFQISVTLLNPF